MNTTKTDLSANGAPDSHDEFSAAYGAWITTAEEFQQLRGEWTELYEAAGSGSMLLSFDSVWARWTNLAEPGSRLAIIAIRNTSSRLVGLAPFYAACSIRGNGARRLSFLAETGGAADEIKILIAPEFDDAVLQETARMLVDHRHEWDYIDLSLPGLMPLLESVGLMASEPAPALTRSSD